VSYMPADVTIFLHYIAGITWHVSQAINSFGVLKQCRFRNSASCEFNCSKLSKRNVNSRDLNLSALDLKKANIIQIRRPKTDIHSNETSFYRPFFHAYLFCPGVPLIFLTRGFGAKFHRPDTIPDSRHTQGFIFPAVAKTPEGRGLIKEQYFEATQSP